MHIHYDEDGALPATEAELAAFDAALARTVTADGYLAEAIALHFTWPFDEVLSDGLQIALLAWRPEITH